MIKFTNRLYKRKHLECVILLLSVICIYAPYEMYITNMGEFWFSLSLFWWIPLFVGLTIFSILSIIGCLLKDKQIMPYEIILFILSLCVYIQGNFLNLRISVLNGSDINWVQYKEKFFINAVTLLAIMIVLAMILIKNKKRVQIMAYFSLFLASIQIVSLIVLITPQIFSQDYKNKYARTVTDKGLYEIGSESNIIIFILDMFDDAYFKEILNSEPDIKEQLDGFTYFSNFTGSYSTTNYSIAHLSSGKFFYNDGSWDDWQQNILNDRMYLDEILDIGYELDIYSDFINYFPTRFADASNNYIEMPLKINNKLNFICDFYKLSAIKYLPDFVKPYLWMTGAEFENYKQVESEYSPYPTENLIFKDKIDKHGISVAGNEKQIKFIHISGVHYPYLNDENALAVEANSVSRVQCARGVLCIVQDYIKKLKQNGSYNNSSIILVADHGYYWDGVVSNPVFLVKPYNSSGEFTINNAPVCQADFAPTILELIDLNQDHYYGTSAFGVELASQRERFFYQYYLQENDGAGVKWRLIQYKAPFESNNPEDFNLTDVEYTVNGRQIKHSDYCKTCKSGDTNLIDIMEGSIGRFHEKDTGYPE